jgi:hypothetical protein
MLMVLFSPLFWLVLKIVPFYISLLALAALWFFVPQVGLLKSGHGWDALIFFSLGTLISLYRASIGWVDRYGKIIVGLFVSFALGEAVFRTLGLYTWHVHRLTIVIGILFFWYLSGKIASMPKIFLLLTSLSGYSFFLYASHNTILLKTVRGSLQLMLPHNSFGIWTAYVLSPLIAVPLLICFGYLLRRYMPVTFATLNGQRESPFT